MQIPDYKPQNNLVLNAKACVPGVTTRDLLPILIRPSRLWMRWQLFVSLCFINAGFFALMPYGFSYLHLSSPIWVLFIWLSLHFLFFIYAQHKNKSHQHSMSNSIRISVKNGIWLVESDHKKLYCELRSTFVCWRWLIIIPLYCAETRRTIRLIIPKDSLTPQDNADLRRWIQSEFI